MKTDSFTFCRLEENQGNLEAWLLAVGWRVATITLRSALNAWYVKILKQKRRAAMPRSRAIVSTEHVERSILLVRGHKVILDADIAELYGVEIRALTQAVKRNLDRFPADFMFQLTWQEAKALRSQFVTLDGAPEGPSSPYVAATGRGKHRKYRPYAFTEQGVAMLSSVLRSKRAVQVNIEIMRAFVRLRSILSSHAELARKLDALERRYDSQFKVIFDAIRAAHGPACGTQAQAHRLSSMSRCSRCVLLLCPFPPTSP